MTISSCKRGTLIPSGGPSQRVASERQSVSKRNCDVALARPISRGAGVPLSLIGGSGYPHRTK
jgi:hypothetical protein